MEEYGYKYIHKLSQFVKILSSRKTRTINMVPNKVKNSDFMSILYGKPIREFPPPKFAICGKVRISKIDLPFRKVYKPQFTEEILEIVALARGKTSEIHYKKTIRIWLYVVNFTRKTSLQSFENGFLHNRVGLKRILRIVSQ